MTLPVQFVAIVDPYESGRMFAPEFGRHGYACLAVQSCGEVPAEYRAEFRPGDYAEIIRHDGDLKETLKHLQDGEVRFVIAGSEWGVNLADQLSEALGLLSNGTKLSEARRNKTLMAQAAREHGLRTAEQLCSDRLDPLLDWVSGRNVWPVVVKPPHSMSAESVRLCTSLAEVEIGFKAIKGYKNKLGLMNETVLVQEFLRGVEYVVDTVSYAGQHRLAAIWKYGRPAPMQPLLGPFRTKELLPAEGELQRQLFDYAQRLLDALAIRYGPAHCELMWVDGAPVLVEVGARLHGGEKAHLLSRVAMGSSQLDVSVECYLQPERFLKNLGNTYNLARHAVMVLLMPRRKGRLKSLNGLSEINSFSSCHEVHVDTQAGQPVPDIVGLVTLVHGDRAMIDRDLQRLAYLEENGMYDIEI